MSNSEGLRAVVFDLGGVLIEFRGAAKLREWRPELTPEETWRRWLSSPSVRALETGRLEPGEFAARLTAEFGLAVSPEEFLTEFADWVVGPLAGGADLVRRIPAHIARATLSNTSHVHWPRFEAQEWFHLFDHHFPSHLTGKIKPDRETFEHAASVLQCRPESILFLDDQPINVRAAEEAGFRAACVQGPGEAEKILLKLGIITG